MTLTITPVTKEKPGFWTRRRAFEQVRGGSNIQLLSFSLVADVVRYSRPQSLPGKGEAQFPILLFQPDRLSLPPRSSPCPGGCATRTSPSPINGVLYERVGPAGPHRERKFVLT